MSYAHLYLISLLVLISAAPLSTSNTLNEDILLSAIEKMNLTACPPVPVCNCHCAPVITVTYPTVPPTCPDFPTPSTTNMPASTTSSTSSSSTRGSTTQEATTSTTATVLPSTSPGSLPTSSTNVTPTATSTITSSTMSPTSSSTTSTTSSTTTSTTTPTAATSTTTKTTLPTSTSMASSTTAASSTTMSTTTSTAVTSTTPITTKTTFPASTSKASSTTATLTTASTITSTAATPTTTKTSTLLTSTSKAGSTIASSTTTTAAPTSRSTTRSSTTLINSSSSKPNTLMTGTTNNAPMTIFTSGPTLDNCQAILNADSGSFASPYYPYYNYPNNANCSWLIIASSRIELWFTVFRTESDHDVVKVYDGPTTSSYRILSNSGTYLPSRITSNSYQVLITFTTDSSVTDKGFNASYSLYVPPTPPPVYRCGKNITLTLNESEQFLESPNFPNTYPNNSDCTWLISSPPGTKIEMSFLNFSTGSSDSFTVYVQRPDYYYNNYRLLQMSGFANHTCIYLSSNNQLFAFFRSGYSAYTFSGFRVRFTIQKGCGGYLNNSTQGLIETPGARIMYYSFYTCMWNIRVEPGKKVHLSFDKNSNSSNMNNFFVYEGNTTSDVQLLLNSGDTRSLPLPFTIISQTNEIMLIVNTNENGCSNGGVGKLRFSYTATTSSKYGCGGTMDLVTKTVSSPGYPTNYTARSLSCYWNIKKSSGSKINISFPQYIDIYPGSLYYGSGDVLKIWENDTAIQSGTLIFEMTGTIHPYPIVTLSNAARIGFFTSNYLDVALYKGWSITWN